MEGIEKIPESLTEIEDGVDSVIEKAIFEGSFVGSGKDGVVLKIDTHAFDQKNSSLFEKEGFHFDNAKPAAAAKILKIYKSGKGKIEYDTQKEALEILEKEEGVARIPNVIGIRDQKVTERDRDFLNRLGTHLDNRMEVFIMDFVEGKDLATLMYEFVLKKKGYEAEDIEKMEFDEKHLLVTKFLEYAVAGGKDHNEGRRALEEAAVAKENSDKLYKFLKQKGFILDKNFLNKIEKSLLILAKNNIRHNDMHERNIMKDTDGEPVIIDFGRSKHNDNDEISDDFAAIKRWKYLTTTPEEDVKHEREEEITKMQEKETFIKTNKKWIEKTENIKKRLQKDVLSTLENEFITAKTSETEIENFLVTLKSLLRDDSVEGNIKTTIRDFISLLPNRTSSPFVKQKIKTSIRSGWLS